MRSPSATFTTLAAALLLSACSAQQSDESASTSETAAEAGSADAQSSESAGPGIGGVVAPGVAFTYNYAFTLPAKAIAGLQQQHASTCEKLGASRCRVTGMTYRQPQEGEVEARIDFLLAPDLAHRFGSEGIVAVEAAEGKLDNATVDGENAGGAISLSQAGSAAIQSEVERIELRLKAKGLTQAERVELTRRAEDLHEQLRGEAQTRRDKEASIATTPVTFAYASEGVLGGNTFGKAASASWSSATSLGAIVLLVAGVALPWLLLALLVGLLWRSPDLRRFLRRLFGVGSSEPGSTP